MRTPFPVLIANWNYILYRKSMQSIKSLRDSPSPALPYNWWDICNIRENQNIWNICFFTISGQHFHSCHFFKIQGLFHRQEKFLGGKGPFLHEDKKQRKEAPHDNEARSCCLFLWLQWNIPACISYATVWLVLAKGKREP